VPSPRPVTRIPANPRPVNRPTRRITRVTPRKASAGSTPPADSWRILLEDGDALLAENDNNLVLESAA